MSLLAKFASLVYGVGKEWDSHVCLRKITSRLEFSVSVLHGCVVDGRGGGNLQLRAENFLILTPAIRSGGKPVWKARV